MTKYNTNFFDREFPISEAHSVSCGKVIASKPFIPIESIEYTNITNEDFFKTTINSSPHPEHLTLVELNNVYIINSVGIVTSDGQFISEQYSGRHLPYDLEFVSKGNIRIGSKALKKIKETVPVVIKDESFMLQSVSQGYGHIVTESITALWSLKFLPKNIKFLVFTQKNIFSSFLNAFGKDENDIIVCNNYITFCKKLYVATKPLYLYSYCSKHATMIWQIISNYYKKIYTNYKNIPDKIYISRRGFPTRRKLLEENKIEKLFEKFGFTVVYPELMDINTQLALFSQAKVIGAPYGSGIFNALFSKKGAKLLVLCPNYSFNNHFLYYDDIVEVSAFYGEQQIKNPEHMINLFDYNWKIPDICILSKNISAWLDGIAI